MMASIPMIFLSANSTEYLVSTVDGTMPLKGLILAEVRFLSIGFHVLAIISSFDLTLGSLEVLSMRESHNLISTASTSVSTGSRVSTVSSKLIYSMAGEDENHDENANIPPPTIPIWEVYKKGNGPVQVSTDTNGQIRVLPPKTAEEILARERERKARTTLIMSIPEDHLANFHKITDAKEMWEAIKSRFGGVSTKDANQKFLRSLPTSWSQVSLIMRTKPGVESLSFDDLYNNLRVFEPEVKGSTGSSSSAQNVAFVSSSTSSTNDVSIAYGVSTSFGHNSQREGSSSYTDELMYSFFSNQSNGPQLDHEDLEQKTGRKLQFDAKEPVGFDKTKVECFNCHNTGQFARECRSKGNQESRRKDAGNTRYKAKDNERRPGKQGEPKALVTIDGDGIHWTGHAKEEQENFALMTYSNSGSDTKVTTCSKECEESYVKLKKLHDEQREQLGDASIEIQACTQALKKMSAKDKSGLRYGDQIHEGVLSYENEVLESVFDSRSSDVEDSLVNDRFGTGQGKNRPVWNNVQRLNHQNKFVPKAVLTKTGRFPVNAARQNLSSQAVALVTARKRFSGRVLSKIKDETSESLKDFIGQIENQLNQKVKTIRCDIGIEFKNRGIIELLWVKRRSKREYSMPKSTTKWKLITVRTLVMSLIGWPVIQRNKLNTSHSAGTQDNINAGNSKMEAETAEEYFVLPLWSSYTSTVKSSKAKNGGEKPNRDTDSKTNEKPADQEDQAFLEELERLKRQEKEANDAAEAFTNEFTQCTEDLLLQAGAARANSTNTVSTVSTPVSTTSPSRIFSTGGPSYPDLTNNDQDDSQIPALMDIYDNPSNGIFTNASYDDEGAVADFTNLETTVNVSPIPTSRIHSIHPTTQKLLRINLSSSDKEQSEQKFRSTCFCKLYSKAEKK
ncbi:ribonuclease H-like domain-containing protein [Tanacetum coccineum]